jgi:hypothetical protein
MASDYLEPLGWSMREETGEVTGLSFGRPGVAGERLHTASEQDSMGISTFQPNDEKKGPATHRAARQEAHHYQNLVMASVCGRCASTVGRDPGDE